DGETRFPSEDTKMTLMIELSPDQQAALEEEANSCGMNLAEFVRLRLLETVSGKTKTYIKTTADILSGWDASGLPSVYGRDSEDAVVIARRLRRQAESR